MTEYRHKVAADQPPPGPKRSRGAPAPTPSRADENNHVHPLVNLPPKATPSKQTNSSKGVDFRRVRQEFPDSVKHDRRAQRLRPGPYFADSADGAPLPVVRQYTEQHNRPT
ncbi:hypothetical protein GCM10009759_31150 [Kitasatospora saccharophila]|uniref:Transposase IS200-like domain-containing protein n=1 Tax=Kitasatospora saccharophila TaxID=407973 RepID=A0ABN2WV40_9ACTN